MIREGLVRRAYRRSAKDTVIFRAYTKVPGALNAIPGSSFQDTIISPAMIVEITQREKLKAAGAYDEVEKVISFECQAVPGRPELADGLSKNGDRINIGGTITNNILSGGVNYRIIDCKPRNSQGFKLTKLFVKAER